jgi:hypothetical protein
MPSNEKINTKEVNMSMSDEKMNFSKKFKDRRNSSKKLEHTNDGILGNLRGFRVISDYPKLSYYDLFRLLRRGILQPKPDGNLYLLPWKNFLGFYCFIFAKKMKENERK